MTTYNKATLKTFFETNDVPGGTDYANLIDSQINIVETALQTMAGPLQATELVAARVSAGNVNVTGTLGVFGLFAADALAINSIYVSGITSAAGKIFGNTDLAVSGNTTTGTLTITGQTSASNLNVAGELIRAPITYSAAGTAQATATVISAGIAILTGASDGQATGYSLMANKTGLVQHVYNQNTVSANLWPCVGGQINVLASNAAFGMAASTLYTVVHTRASGYAVK